MANWLADQLTDEEKKKLGIYVESVAPPAPASSTLPPGMSEADVAEIQARLAPKPQPAPIAAPKRAPSKAVTSKVEPKAEMNPLVKEYIKKKYGFEGDLSDDALKSAQGRAKDERFTADIGSAAATVGAAIAGTKADTSFYDKLRDGSGQDVRDIQERRKSQMDDLTKKKGMRDAELSDLEDDTGSDVSRTYQQLASKMVPGRDFSKMSASEVKRILPSMEKLYEMRVNAARVSEDREFRRAVLGAKTAKEKEKADYDKTVEGRLAKMSGESKGRLDNSRSGYKAVRDMTDAYNAGDNTWRLPLTGDNDFTEARRRFEEALGRMQSGGQISGQEAKKFRDMLPTVTDSEDMQQKKLANVEQEMRARMKTLGFTPEEFDMSPPTQSPAEYDVDHDEIEAELRRRGGM